MSEIRQIIEQFPLDELQVNSATKKSIRILVEYIHETRSSFPVVIQLASILINSCREEIKMTEEFRSAHPENRAEVYSAPEVFLAFYLLMLSQKADNLYHIQKEKKIGICKHLSIVCQHDNETCSACKEKEAEIEISGANYETVPPFHVGCRCGILITK